MLVALLVVVLATVDAPPAAADPPGPTDYRSEILALEPAVDGLVLRFIGGDSFLELEADGRQVVVFGYRGERLYRFAEDGTVEENRASPSYALNDDRYGEVSDDLDSPEGDLAEDWHVVATSGRWAWHDHRTHWMHRARPPGRSPGDVVLEAVVPIEVDGQPVAVHVRSTWAPESAWPQSVAAGIGVAVAALVAVLGRRSRTGPDGSRRRRLPTRSVVAGLLGVGAASAGVVGLAAAGSVPAEVGLPATGWILPLGALCGSVAVVIVDRLGRSTLAVPFLGAGAVALAAWVWSARHAWSHPITVSPVPIAGERAVVVGAAIGAGLAMARVVADLRR